MLAIRHSQGYISPSKPPTLTLGSLQLPFPFTALFFYLVQPL